MMNEPFAMTVSQLNEYMKTLIDSSPVLSNVCIVGEISNFTNHYKTGHLYFTLKDESALVKAVMFRTYTGKLRFVPKDNMKVLVYGRISVFARDGVYQLYAEDMEQFGVGDLYLKFEELKKKLSSLGMFDEQYKKPLPRFPKRIGIITSPEAAAVADMKNILTRRYPLCEIHIYPALVQGPGAPKELCDGIVHFDNDPDCDCIIIGRGGGSIEDLWAFNDETLAKTIFACKTPVISAVGHETDFTICDFVADRRAPTPSAAAEIAVPDMQDLKRQLLMISSSLKTRMGELIGYKRQYLQNLAERRSLKSPMYYVDSKQELLLSYEKQINTLFEALYKSKANILSVVSSKLAALNPMAVLSRGYAAVFDGEGKVINSVTCLKENDEISLQVADGKAKAKISKIIPKGE
ncbi:MAG: exodeoxyribonuclease VII large subunit [Ruminococcaceae bacterium]|nr:exodeoxyribonuclease VII large subunit [Oscillospiraceae bacterium]